MNQSLFGESFGMARATTYTDPRMEGERLAKLCEQKAEKTTPGFPSLAKQFIVAHLSECGALSSEAIVDAATKAGLNVHDKRAWGPAFAALLKSEEIKCVGTCLRKKGHGTAGGRVYEVAR